MVSQNKQRVYMRQSNSKRRNISTRSNRNRSRSPEGDSSSRNRGGRTQSISTKSYKARRNINIQTKGFAETKRSAETKQKIQKLTTKGGLPPSANRKRRLDITFESNANKRQAREERFSTGSSPAVKKKELTSRAGNPDKTQNKVGLFSLKSKPTKASPTQQKPELLPEPQVEKTKPVIQTKPKPNLLVKKAFVTLRPDPVPSSSEESESESETEETHGMGPKLEVKANDGALILVRNLPKEVTARHLLLELFDRTPGIEQVAIHTDDNGESKGTADVAVSDVATAREVIAKSRTSVYRGHEIYMTLMGTSMVKNQTEQVIAPLPKHLRSKKEKKRKKKRKESSKKSQSSKKSSASTTQVSQSVKATPTRAKSPSAETPPKARQLRMLTPNCIDPFCRPWNWGTSRPERTEYNEESVVVNWEDPDDTYYHVTMKKELQNHLPDVAGA